MIKSSATMAQQIAEAAIAFEQGRTGHTPKSVTVVQVFLLESDVPSHTWSANGTPEIS